MCSFQLTDSIQFLVQVGVPCSSLLIYTQALCNLLSVCSIIIELVLFSLSPLLDEVFEIISDVSSDVFLKIVVIHVLEHGHNINATLCVILPNALYLFIHDTHLG